MLAPKEFIELMEDTFPEYEFDVSPQFIDPATLEPFRRILVRDGKGNMNKLKTMLRSGLLDDARVSEIILNPEFKLDLKQEINALFIEEIREELAAL